MSPSPSADSAPSDPYSLLRAIKPYGQPSSARSLFELAITAVPFVLLWLLMWAALSSGIWLGMLLAIPAGGFLLRLFLIQHDCGHDAFFKRRASNDWVGRILGIVTLTPYDYWRRSHARHHASTGNLDQRGVGDVDTITVAEFRSRGRMKQLAYRIYRHPLVLFGLGPAYLFLLRHRFPLGMMRSGWGPWISVVGTNIGILILWTALIWLVGLKLFLLIHLPITIAAASLGVWFFYVQHQFEDTIWDRSEDWTFHHAALHGSSYYELPGILRWFSANIGVHHVHHLASRIPFYRLPEVMRDFPQLAELSRVTIRESFKAVRLVLWDEEKRRLVSFREAKASLAS